MPNGQIQSRFSSEFTLDNHEISMNYCNALERLRPFEEMREWMHRSAIDKRPAQILEIGCGAGNGLARLCGASPDLKGLGVDISPHMVDYATRIWAHLPNVTFVHGAAENIPFLDRSFDIVMCERVLQHVSSLETVVGEARRVCKNGGSIIICEPDWSACHIDHPNQFATNTILRNYQCAIRNPAVGWQLENLFSNTETATAAFEISRVRFDPRESDLVFGPERAAEIAVAKGLPRHIAANWVETFHRAGATMELPFGLYHGVTEK